MKNIQAEPHFNLSKYLLKQTRQIGIAPLIVMMCILIFHYLYLNYFTDWLDYFAIPVQAIVLEGHLYAISLILSSYWLVLRVVNKSASLLTQTSLFKNHFNLRILLPFLALGLKIIAFLVLFNFVTQYLGLPQELTYLLERLSSVMIIVSISWILFKLVDVLEQILLQRYTSKIKDNLAARRIYTQTLILKRVLYALLSICTVGAILMLFDNVRALGASVLTTAGIAGLVLTFTAQRSLTSIFAGLEIAMTQPIKIGDSIVINQEFGAIEQINFRHVIVKLWDWRRLVVPTSYFLENSFQNWSREEDNSLLASVDLYMDFTLPVNKVREYLQEVLSTSPCWDGHIGKLVVQDLKETVMQLRILASAKNADKASNLKAEIREKIVSYIVENYPQCLPIVRSHQ